MNGWPEAITRLRARTGVAPALAAALVLAEARARWEELVVVATAGNDLLFSRPGDAYPFPLDVRIGLAGTVYSVRLVAQTAIVERSKPHPRTSTRPSTPTSDVWSTGPPEAGDDQYDPAGFRGEDAHGRQTRARSVRRRRARR